MAQSFYPYGEDRGTVEPNDELKFATYTRDAATGLDYADQRYYASNWGRFMSPDPYKASVGPKDPGSWNRYAYTRGDPVNKFDVTGLDDSGFDCTYVWDPINGFSYSCAAMLRLFPPPAASGALGSPGSTVANAGFLLQIWPSSPAGAKTLASAEQLATQWLKGAQVAPDCFDISGSGFNPQQVLTALTTGGGTFTGPAGNQIRLFSVPLPSAVVAFTFPNVSLWQGGPELAGADIYLNSVPSAPTRRTAIAQ